MGARWWAAWRQVEWAVLGGALFVFLLTHSLAAVALNSVLTALALLAGRRGPALWRALWRARSGRWQHAVGLCMGAWFGALALIATLGIVAAHPGLWPLGVVLPLCAALIGYLLAATY